MTPAPSVVVARPAHRGTPGSRPGSTVTRRAALDPAVGTAAIVLDPRSAAGTSRTCPFRRRPRYVDVSPNPPQEGWPVTSRLNPYIGFPDTARQALEFYRGVFGGDLALSTFGEAGAGGGPPARKNKDGGAAAPAGGTVVGSRTPPGK